MDWQAAFFYLYYTTPAGYIVLNQKTLSKLKDLGVILSSYYNWSVHINSVAAGARKLAGWALGVFRDRSTLVMLTIWKSIIRCKIKYCVILINMMTSEDVQRFFTRHISGLQETHYWERLNAPQSLSYMGGQHNLPRLYSMPHSLFLEQSYGIYYRIFSIHKSHLTTSRYI